MGRAVIRARAATGQVHGVDAPTPGAPTSSRRGPSPDARRGPVLPTALPHPPGRTGASSGPPGRRRA